MLLDPGSGRRGDATLRMHHGRIVEAAKDVKGPAELRIDATGCLVVPGLIDLHCHAFTGQDLGVDMSAFAPPSGVTTIADAGSAGAHMFPALRRVLDGGVVRAFAFVNISTIGTTSILLAGECENLSYCDEDAAVRTAKEHRDRVVGIKVRASGNVVGANGAEPFFRALRAADRARLPLMVHIGPPPPDISTLLAHMRPGDVLTHCFTGFDNRIVRPDGALVDGLREARERGVLLDVGHGMAGFDARVAAAGIKVGVYPDIISTDLHAYSVASARGLDRLLTLFLALGMPVDELVAAATATPARVLRREDLGTLAGGTPGDVAVLRIDDDRVELRDPAGRVVEADQRVRVLATLRAGRLVYADASLPIETSYRV